MALTLVAQRLLSLVAICWCLQCIGICAAFAQDGPPKPALLDTMTLQKVAPDSVALFNDFLLGNHNRAFVVSNEGKSSWVSGRATLQEAEDQAKAACEKAGRTGCRVYAFNNDIVIGGQPLSLPPPVATYGEFKSQPAYFWYGPKAARGAVVWSHGNNGAADASKSPTPTWVRAFSNAGWDVYRFDREASYDRLDWATRRLIEGVALLKQAGYGRVLSLGQSRGGFHSLNALGRANLIDGVVATAPAAHGTWQQGANVLTKGFDDYRSTLKDIERSDLRIVIALFKGDDYDPDPDLRASTAKTTLGSKGIPNMIINQPADLAGHGAGGNFIFAQRYGACIVQFFAEPPPPSPTCP
jgi:hypothetical protein